jgi:limonene-1,2-epoxide hydrolase
MERVVPTVRTADDWSPLEEFVAVDGFGRVGVFMETQDWAQYLAMLTRWATATDSFETTVRRISEVGSLVYYEIEERHFRGDTMHVVNSMTVFAFDGDGKIRQLNVYVQQPR